MSFKWFKDNTMVRVGFQNRMNNSKKFTETQIIGLQEHIADHTKTNQISHKSLLEKNLWQTKRKSAAKAY